MQQIYKYTNIQIYKYTNVRIYKCTNVQIYKYTNTKIYKYANTKIFKGGEAGQTDNPAVKPSASGGFTNDPSDLGLEMTDSEDEVWD